MFKNVKYNKLAMQITLDNSWFPGKIIQFCVLFDNLKNYLNIKHQKSQIRCKISHELDIRTKNNYWFINSSYSYMLVLGAEPVTVKTVDRPPYF